MDQVSMAPKGWVDRLYEKDTVGNDAAISPSKNAIPDKDESACPMTGRSINNHIG